MSEEQQPVEVQENQAAEPVQKESGTGDINVSDIIAESKKYRQRSQKAEQKLEKLQKQLDTDRQKQMEENQQWKELAEERANKISQLEPIVEQYQQTEQQIRAELLSDFPEDDQDDFKDLPTPALRKVHNKLLKQKVARTESSVAGISTTPSKRMTDMNQKEKRENWQGIIASYRNKR